MERRVLSLEEVVADERLMQLFVDYLEVEMVLENFLFWLDVEKFKTSKLSERKAFFDQIFRKYIAINAECEIYIYSQWREEIESQSQDPPLHIFDRLQQEVFMSLSQILPRFTRTETYQSFASNRPDSPRTRLSRQKLEQFFGMELKGTLIRNEIVQLVEVPAYEKSLFKRRRQKKVAGMKRTAEKLVEPSFGPSASSSSLVSSASTLTDE